MNHLKSGIALAVLGFALPLALAASLPERYVLAGTLRGEKVQLELTLEVTADITLSASGKASAHFIGDDRKLEGRIQEGRIRLSGAGLKLTGSLPEQYDEGPQAFAGTLASGETFTLPIVASYLEQRTAQGPFMDVASETPVFTRAPWKGINGSLGRFVQTPATTFLREAQRQSSAGNLNYFSTYENRLETLYLTPTLLSVLESQFFYTGGAHPNTTYRSQTYYASGGSVKRLTLQDIFGGKVPDVLLNDVTERLKRQKASMILDGTVRLKLRDLSVFNLTQKGLSFTFAPYAVATYAEGAFTVTIPYEQLEGDLNASFLPRAN